MKPDSQNHLVVVNVMQELAQYVPKKAIQELLSEAASDREISNHAKGEVLLKELQELVKNKRISVEKIEDLVQNYKHAGIG
jgi:hypothetical protein